MASSGLPRRRSKGRLSSKSKIVLLLLPAFAHRRQHPEDDPLEGILDVVLVVAAVAEQCAEDVIGEAAASPFLPRTGQLRMPSKVRRSSGSRVRRINASSPCWNARSYESSTAGSTRLRSTRKSHSANPPALSDKLIDVSWPSP